MLIAFGKYVLEGSTKSFKDPKSYFNIGAGRIPYHHHKIVSYCKELGVELQIFCNDNRGALYQSDDAFDGKPIKIREYISDSRGAIAELLAKAVKAQSLDEELTDIDQEALLGFLKSFGDLNSEYKYVGTKRAGYVEGDVGGVFSSTKKTPRSLDSLLST